MVKLTKRTLRRSLSRSRGRRLDERSPDVLLLRSGLIQRDGRAGHPVIGVTTTTHDVVTPDGSTAPGDAALVEYARLIHELRAVPVLLPPVTSVGAVLGHLGLCDGIVLAGGFDVHPNLTGIEAGEVGLFDPRKDRYEWQLIDHALEGDMPLLAIGRGFLLLNAFFGGTTAPFEGPMAPPARQSAQDRSQARRHRVDLVQGTKLAGVLARKQLDVARHGSQCVELLGEGLVVCARARDGTIEGGEVPDRRFGIGVQFHPELIPQEDRVGKQLFAGLVAAAKERAAGA